MRFSVDADPCEHLRLGPLQRPELVPLTLYNGAVTQISVSISLGSSFVRNTFHLSSIPISGHWKASRSPNKTATVYGTEELRPSP